MFLYIVLYLSLCRGTLGKGSKGKMHSDACRARIAEAMAVDPDGQRRLEEQQRRMEGAAGANPPENEVPENSEVGRAREAAFDDFENEHSKRRKIEETSASGRLTEVLGARNLGEDAGGDRKRGRSDSEVAATMYAIMKKKSADFRAQTGNRYMRSLECADWNKIVVNGEMFTILWKGGDQAGLSYRCPICKVEKDLHYKKSGITDDEGRRRLQAWAANCVPNHHYSILVADFFATLLS